MRLRRWHNLHAKEDATTRFDVVLATVHLGEQQQAQRWLSAINVPEGYHVQDIWRW